MTLVESSVSYRAARRMWVWLAGAARASVTGRLWLGLVAVLTRVFTDSFTFSTRRLRSVPLARTGHPLSVLILSEPYLWLRRLVGRSVAGRTARAAETQLVTSRFAGGLWAGVAGSAVCALGLGRLILIVRHGVTTVYDTGVALATPGLRLIAPIGLMLVGGLMLVSGSGLLPAFRTSVVGRGLAMVTGGWPRNESFAGRTGPAVLPRGRWTLFAGCTAALAAVGGAAAGLTAGSGALLATLLVVLICVVALLLVRPEVMLLAVAAFPWLDWAARRALGSLGGAWDDALLLVSIALLLWSVVVLRRWRLWTVPIFLPLLIAFATALGSVVLRDVPGDVALYALRILLEPLLFYFLGFLFPKDKRWVRAAVLIFVLAGAAMALHGLYQYVTKAPMPASWVDVHETDITTRAYSIVDNPNGLGAFLLMGALLSLSLALSRASRAAARLAWATVCAIHLAGIAVTFSRGAWIGLGAGVVVLLVAAYRRYLVPLVGAGVVAWFVAPAAFVQRLTFAFSSAYVTKSANAGRLYVWRIALNYIADHPWLGVGLGTFGGTSAVTFGYSRLWVDNFYLQLAAEGGLLLLGFFLWLLLTAATGLIKGRKMTEDPYLGALSAGMLGAFVSVAVANFTASVWETLTVGVGFWFLTGLVTSATMHEGEKPGEVQA